MSESSSTAQIAPVFVESHDGTEIALYDLSGAQADDRPPLLICHATGFCAGAYRPFAAELADRFHVWAMDFRGHGASQLPAGTPFTWDDYAHDVLAAIDHLGGPVHLFGHSMGGGAAMQAELFRPGSVAAAWLFEPIIFPPLPDDRPKSEMGDMARRRRVEFDSRAEVLARYAARPPLGIFRADVLAAYVEHGFIDTDQGTVRLACHPEQEAQTFEKAGTVTTEMVSAIEIPVTIAKGLDTFTNSVADFVSAIVAAMPNATEAAFDHMGHFGPLRDPTRIARSVLEFFDRVP